jgi:hypothetical protein
MKTVSPTEAHDDDDDDDNLIMTATIKQGIEIRD